MGWQDAPIVDAPAATPAWQSAPEVPQGDASQWGPSMEAANAAMFGMGPKINQWIGEHLPASIAGPPVNANQQQAGAQAWEQQNPKASMAANVVGGAVPYAVGAATGGAGFIPQAAIGAIGNSLLPLSQGQDPTSAALGGAASGAAGKLGGALLGRMLGSAGSGAAGAFKPAVNVPTAAALSTAKNAAYDASEAAGDIAAPQGLARLKANIQGEMANSGYDEGLHPGGKAVINRMNEWPTTPAPPPQPGYSISPTALPKAGPLPLYTGSSPPPAPTAAASAPPGGWGARYPGNPGSWATPTNVSPVGTPVGPVPTAGVTLKGIDGFRQIINNMRQGGAAGSRLAGQLTSHVDDFVANPQPGDWLTGAGPAGSQALDEGRRLAQIGFKNDDFSALMGKGADQALASGSGGNMRNKLAQAAVKLKWGDQNWTPDEASAIQNTITPGVGEQALRVMGKLDPTAHGLSALGEGLAGLLGAERMTPEQMAMAGGAIGTSMAARRLSDALVKRSADKVGATILNGGVNPYAPSPAQTAIGSSVPALQRLTGSLLSATPRAVYSGQ
jgi:hypothetical protein